MRNTKKSSIIEFATSLIRKLFCFSKLSLLSLTPNFESIIPELCDANHVKVVVR